MEFVAQLKNGKQVTVEVYYDERPGVEPGWCWRADKGNAGGDTIEDVAKEDAVFALQCAKSAWGVE